MLSRNTHRLWLPIFAALILMLSVVSCGGDATPAPDVDQPPESTNTPTPLPAPSATPAPIRYDDESNDALSCQTCQPSPGMSLRPVMDITSAQVEKTTIVDTCYYVFQLEFGQVETFNEIFVGGVEFLDPEMMVLVDFNWCFNSTAQYSFNFSVMPGQPFETFYAYVGPAGQWVAGEDPRYIGTMEDNIITLNIPCSLVEEDWLWMVGCTDASMMVCDELGLGTDLAAGLPLP